MDFCQTFGFYLSAGFAWCKKYRAAHFLVAPAGRLLFLSNVIFCKDHIDLNRFRRRKGRRAGTYTIKSFPLRGQYRLSGLSSFMLILSNKTVSSNDGLALPTAV